MPTLTVTIPSSLETVLKDAVVGPGSSLDSVVTAALSQYFQSDRHRANRSRHPRPLCKESMEGPCRHALCLPTEYAEAFGATGLRIDHPSQITPMLREAFDLPGPVLVEVHVDYKENVKLLEQVYEGSIL